MSDVINDKLLSILRTRRSIVWPYNAVTRELNEEEFLAMMQWLRTHCKKGQYRILDINPSRVVYLFKDQNDHTLFSLTWS